MYKIIKESIASSACYKGKLARALYKKPAHHTHPGPVLSMDITGKIAPTEEVGEKYIATFTNFARKYSFVMPLPRKSEVYNSIVTAIQYTIRTFGWPPTVVHSNNAKEYVSAAV